MAAPPALGALGMTFTVMRAMQFAGLIIIIGLSSSFVSEIVASSYTAPPALIGTLVIVSGDDGEKLRDALSTTNAYYRPALPKSTSLSATFSTGTLFSRFSLQRLPTSFA